MSANDKNNALVILTEFERRLAACTTLVEAKAMRDEAETLRHYAKTMRMGIVAENRCAAARYLVERKLGEMLEKLPRAPGPGRGKKNSVAPESFLKTLAAEGIRYFSAEMWQRWARVPEPEFREWLENYCTLKEDWYNRSGQTLNGGAVEHYVEWYIREHPTAVEKARAERERLADEAATGENVTPESLRALRERQPEFAQFSDEELVRRYERAGEIAERRWQASLEEKHTWNLGDDQRAKDRLTLLQWVEGLLADARNRLLALHQHHGADVGDLLTKVESVIYDLERRYEAIVHGGLSPDRGLLLYACRESAEDGHVQVPHGELARS